MPAPWTLSTNTEPIPAALAAELAARTRAAFADADLVPGLPHPDGLYETSRSVVADMARGAWLCIARDRDGTIVGSVRAFAVPGKPTGLDWEVRRLAVVPALRGAGLARALMAALEDGARAAGARAVTLDTVVERGNPAFYARLGYRTVRHFPSPDKALSEVGMERVLDTPAGRLDHPWDGEDADRDYALLVTWHTDGVRTMARLHRDVTDAIAVASSDHPGWSFAGADGSRTTSGRDLASVSESLGIHPDGTALDGTALDGTALDGTALDGTAVFDGPPATVPAYRMPRLSHPDLLALWRVPPR